MEQPDFSQLIKFLRRIPAIREEIFHGQNEDLNWWIKFSIDTKSRFAWNVVQELGHILNYISLSERLPVSFYPVSAPPYMNGGPDDFLYWIIESKQTQFSPDQAKEWLEVRLPHPVDSIDQWNLDV